MVGNPFDLIPGVSNDLFDFNAFYQSLNSIFNALHDARYPMRLSYYDEDRNFKKQISPFSITDPVWDLIHNLSIPRNLDDQSLAFHAA